MKRKTIRDYQSELIQIDKNTPQGEQYASMLILAIVEEVGEMARAYLTKVGKKPHNIRAQKDESYRQELGDIIVAIMKLAYIKKIDLDKQINYTLRKIKRRKAIFH